MKREPSEDLRRLVGFKWIVGLGLGASFLLAPGIWLERPFFTPMPIAGAWRPLSPPLDGVVLAALIVLLGAVLLADRPRSLIFAWVTLLVLRVCWDQATWQPFFLMYGFLLFITAFADWNARGPDHSRAAVLDTARFTVVAVYLWSGFSKLSYGFVHHVLPGLVAATGIRLPDALIFRLGLVLPASEIAIAAGLLFPATRLVSLAAAIVMHAAILLAVGPFGLGYNAIVWPWNLSMIALLVVLFAGTRRVSAWSILRNPGFAPHLAAIALFAVLPGLSYLGLWPTYLSFRLYSDQYHWATISMTPAVQRRLPSRTGKEVKIANDGAYAAHLNVAYWSEHELGAFIPPEPRVFREVARRVCALAGEPGDVRLVIEAPPDRRTGASTRTTLYCDGL